MSAAPKKKTAYPSTTEATVRPLHSDKETIKKLQDSLTKRIIDNPKIARKAAVLIAEWLKKSKK